MQNLNEALNSEISNLDGFVLNESELATKVQSLAYRAKELADELQSKGLPIHKDIREIQRKLASIANNDDNFNTK